MLRNQFIPRWILRLGENFEQLVVREEEESREEQTLLLKILIQALLDELCTRT